MVDTPKETNGDKATEDNPSGKKAKHERIGAAPSLAIAMLALEKKFQIVPKRNTILINPPSSKLNRNTGWLAQMNRRRTDTWRMTTICLTPKMR